MEVRVTLHGQLCLAESSGEKAMSEVYESDHKEVLGL